MKTVALNKRKDRVQLLLACGHWSREHSIASSAFDFPEEPLWCGECKDARQIAPALQMALMEGRI